MNKILKTLCTLLAATAAIGAPAQDWVQFYPSAPVPNEAISEATVTVLKQKVSQILNRNSAAAGGYYGIFEVEPALTVGTENTTSGMVQNISSISGELTLKARNTVDGSEYYSITVPLHATVKGAGADPAEVLAKSIKITDPAFVRFIRIARQNIEKAFDSCCPQILGRARSLDAAGQTADALELLLSVPAAAQCHDEALELIAAYRAKLDLPGPEPLVVAVPVPVPVPVPAPEPAPAPEPEPAPTPDVQPQSTPAPSIYVSSDRWKVRVANCVYKPENRTIELQVVITSLDGSNGTQYTSIRQAVTADGVNLEKFACQGNSYMNYPEEVPVKMTLEMLDVKSNPGMLSFLKMKVGSVEVEIRKLYVK